MTRTTLVLGTSVIALSLAAPARADEPEPTTVLHVASPRVVAVENVETGEILCHSPCDKAVPATARYRIAGSRASEPFVLDARKGSATITVDPASKRGLIAGIAVGSAGIALAAAGAIVLGVATANTDDSPIAGRDGATTDNGFSDAMGAGAVMICAGLAGAIWGGANVMSNWRTSVSGNLVKQSPPAQAFMIPLFGGSF